MENTVRVKAKKLFDQIAYRYGWLNKILRNLNKGISGLTDFRLRPFGILKLTLSGGKHFKLATNETSAFAKKIFWNTPANYEYTSIFEKLVRYSSVFADIGANIGYYSLVAACVNPRIKVFAFEPSPGPLHYLRENVMLNGYENKIEIHPIALSNADGVIEFLEIKTPGQLSRHNLGGAGRMLKEADTKNNITPIQVPTIRADQFFLQNQPCPDLIKMDTEGTENMILDGAHNLIEQHHPIIICETLFNVIEPELERIMLSHGYHFYNFINGKLVKTESIIRSTNNGVSDCFFVHPSKEHLIGEFL